MRTLFKILVISILTSTISLIQAQIITDEANWKETITFININSKYMVSTLEKEEYYQGATIINDTLILKQTKLGAPYKKVMIPLHIPQEISESKDDLYFSYGQRRVLIARYIKESNKYSKPYGTGIIMIKIENSNKQPDLLNAFQRLVYLLKDTKNHPEMIAVGGSTFTMGDAHGLGSKDELPLHEITLNNFNIGKTEVTVAQYRAYCTATGVKMPDQPKWGWVANNPIVNVSWQDAVNYCTWLSKKLNKNITLPTEAQWEYAAKGGEFDINRIYSGGSPGWYIINSNQKAHAVALNKPNKLKLFDMSGNVSEWCLDWYLNNYYKSNPNSNPINTQENAFKVTRGGHWFADKTMCRISNRMYHKPNTKSSGVGFRVVTNY